MRNSAGLGAALAVLSCSDSTGPATYEFEITPEVVAIPQYGTQQLSVDVLDQNGSRTTGVAVTYESSDDDIVAVTRSRSDKVD